MNYLESWNQIRRPNNRRVIEDIKKSLPSIVWEHIQLIEGWNEVDEIICENVASYFISRNFKGVIVSENGDLKSEYIGSALYFQDHTGGPGWKLNKLTLSQSHKA